MKTTLRIFTFFLVEDFLSSQPKDDLALCKGKMKLEMSQVIQICKRKTSTQTVCVLRG